MLSNIMRERWYIDKIMLSLIILIIGMVLECVWSTYISSSSLTRKECQTGSHVKILDEAHPPELPLSLPIPTHYICFAGTWSKLLEGVDKGDQFLKTGNGLLARTFLQTLLSHNLPAGLSHDVTVAFHFLVSVLAFWCNHSGSVKVFHTDSPDGSS